MDTPRIEHYRSIYRQGLLDDVMPFWQRHAPDRTCGGFYSFLDIDGSVMGTDKGIWMAGRTTWCYATLYNNVEQRAQWLELAQHGVKFLRQHAFDTDGRMFFTVTRDGRPLRKRRYLYSECFAAIALAEYARASGDQTVGQTAIDLYKLILRYYTTPGLLEPKVNPQTRRLKSHGMCMILLAISPILRQLDPGNPLYEKTMDQAVAGIRDHHLKPEFQALLEAVGPQGEFLDEPEGRVVNPGHAIESAWFILAEARYRRDRQLLALGLKIIDWHLECGWDQQYGGLRHYVDCRGMPCTQYDHEVKLWWPHNEAIIATLLAHHLSGDEKYLRWHEKLHDWAYAHFPDPQHGEWFGYLNRDGGVLTRIKGSIWKGPFHLPRMLLYCYKLLEEMKPGYAEADQW